MRRWGPGVLAGALVLVALLALRSANAPTPEPAASPTAAPPPRPAAPARPFRPWSPAAAAPVVPDDAHPPSIYEAGHSAVAEVLGFVAIRCWVGPEWDTEDLVGAYHQKISNGWYTNVEDRLAGQHGVEKRFEVPDAPADARDWEKVDFETLFVVSWRAEGPGETVPCEVHTLERATLRVRVIDQEGRAVSGAKVFGCGSGADGDPSGLAVLEEAHAGSDCALRAYRVGDVEICDGTLEVTALAPNEERAIDLPATCSDLRDPSALELGLVEPLAFELEPSPLTELSYEEQIARFQALKSHGLGDGADALLDGLIAHREHMIAWP